MTVRHKKSAEEYRAEAKQLHASVLEQVEALRDSEQWAAFLEYAKKFHRYSVGNILLIHQQMPHATQVAGYRRWQELGRQVRKGEHAIRILGYATKVTQEATETTEEKRRAYFPIVSVFDVSQTDPIDPTDPATAPEIAHQLQGADPEDIAGRTLRYLRSQGWITTTAEIFPGVNGMTDFAARTVTLAPDLSPAHRAKTSLHEAAHALMHALDLDDVPQHRGVCEVEAESVAYILSGLMGLDSAPYSVGYITTWSGANTDTIQQTATRVLATVNTLTDALIPTN